MLTKFGKKLRKIRIDHGEILKDMAEKLGVTASYLSAVETGKRNVPEEWIGNLAVYYHLDPLEKVQLEDAAIYSAKVIKLNLDAVSEEEREAAILFAREFGKLDTKTIDQMKNLLQNQMKKDQLSKVNRNVKKNYV